MSISIGLFLLVFLVVGALVMLRVRARRKQHMRRVLTALRKAVEERQAETQAVH